MFTLRQPSVSPATPSSPTIVLAGLTPVTEALAQSLAKRYTHVTTATAVALETQQLDHSAELAAEEEVKDTVDKYDADHPHTGPLQVYLLDGQGAAVMDQASEDTPLQALVNAVIRNPRRTVAALMPEDENIKAIEDIPPSLILRQLADTILTTEGITTLVGKEAFEAFVKDPSSGIEESFKDETPAIESILVGAGIATAVAAFGAMLWVGIKNARANAAEAYRRAQIPGQLIKAMNDTYLSSSWRKAQVYKTGSIGASGIGPYVTTERGIPSDPAAVAETTIATTKSFIDQYTVAVKHYVSELNRVSAGAEKGSAMLDLIGSVSQTANDIKNHVNQNGSVNRALLGKVKALSNPLESTHYPNSGMLGNVGIHGLDFKRFPAIHGDATELKPFSEAQLSEVAKAVLSLLDVVIDLRVAYSEIEALGARIQALPDSAMDVRNAEGVRQDTELGGYYSRSKFIRTYAHPLRNLAESLTNSAIALDRWMSRSIVGHASIESLSDNWTVNFKQTTDGLTDTATTESLIGAAVIGGIVGAIVGWNKLSANKRKREEGARAAAHPLGEGVHTLDKAAFDDMAKQLGKTFFDPKWCSAHPLHVGTVSASGIAEYLMDGQHIAANPTQSVQKDYVKVTSILRATKALVNPYLKDLEKLSTEALHQLAEGEKSEDYTRVGKYLEAQMPTIRRPEQRGTIPTAELLGNLKYLPGDWQTVGKFIRTVEPTVPHDIPAMTQPIFDEAVKFLKTVFRSDGANLFQMVSTVDYLTPEYSPAHYTELMDSVDNVTIWRFFGDEYGYEHYGDHGANVGPKVYQGYLYLCLEHLATEMEALVKWMERSIEK